MGQRIEFNEWVIEVLPNPDKGKPPKQVWIERPNGEGGEFPIDRFADALSEFFSRYY